MQTGIKFKPCKISSAFQHNKRDEKYLENVAKSEHKAYDLFADETKNNIYWTSPKYQGKSLPEIFEQQKKLVKEMTGRTMQDKATPIREGCCPVRPDTTIEDFRPFAQWLESFGASVISIDIHHDEGHVDPVTGERKYNRHAHVVVDWIREDGRSVKISRKDASEMQTQLAAALDMDRGIPSPKKHLPALEYREKMAGENLARLLKEIETAEKRLKETNTEANREALRSNLLDAGARLASIFGQGAIASSKKEAAKAQKQAADAERRIAKAEKALKAAEKAQKQAENARLSAEQGERRAESEKALYGREMYDKGHQAGYAAGQESTSSSQQQLRDQLDAKQQELDTLKAARNDRAEAAEKDLAEVLLWNPNMKNWKQSLKDMQKAGIPKGDIVKIFMAGSASVEVLHKHNFKDYPVKTDVAIGKSKGAFGVWFKASVIDNTFRNVKDYLHKVQQYIRGIANSNGPKVG